jgi:hypothetical protein
VAKVLAGYPEPDLPVSTPSSRDLKLQISAGEYGLVVTLRDELYKNVFNFESPALNVDTAVIEATFGAVLIHLEEMQTIESSRIKSGSPFTSHYLYHFERGIHTVNRKLGSELTMHQCCEWGSKLNASWQATNFMQVGKSSTGHAGSEQIIAATLTQLLASIHSLQESVHRLTRVQEDMAHIILADCSPTAENRGLSASSPSATSIRTPDASSLAGFFYNWHAEALWQTATEKKEQNARSDIKACVNIMLLLFQQPIHIRSVPLSSDTDTYQQWKQSMWETATELDRCANERLNAIDMKGVTKKATSLRKRWGAIRSKHPSEYRVLSTRYGQLKLEGLIRDDSTPHSHQWTSLDLR